MVPFSQKKSIEIPNFLKNEKHPYLTFDFQRLKVNHFKLPGYSEELNHENH
jgi:hypothetical protein